MQIRCCFFFLIYPFFLLGESAAKKSKVYEFIIYNRPKDCGEVLHNSNLSDGIYKLYVSGVEPFKAYCMRDRDDKKSSAWTVIQRRRNGKVDFYREWNDYKNGFGDLENDFWLGLERMHAMTSKQNYELLIDLETENGAKTYMKYDRFVIGSEADGYPLTRLEHHSGTDEDAFSYHKNQKFTTRDVDNDTAFNKNCAQVSKGGWWYSNCYHCNLNGFYNTTKDVERMTWYRFPRYNTLKYVQMAIRLVKKD